MNQLNHPQHLVKSNGKSSRESGPPDFPNDERRALLSQKFHIITALITVAVRILKEEGLARHDERGLKETHVAKDTFHPRLGAGCDTTDRLHALAVLLAQKGIAIAVGTGSAVVDPSSKSLMLFAAVDISLTKPAHPFPGHQYIEHFDSTVSEPDMGINFVGAAQPGSPLLPARDVSSILKDPLSYALDVSQSCDKSNFLYHVGVMMVFINTIIQTSRAHARATRLSKSTMPKHISLREQAADLKRQIEPEEIKPSDQASQAQQDNLRSSYNAVLDDLKKLQRIQISERDLGQRCVQLFRHFKQYIVATFYRTMFQRLHHPASLPFFNMIISIDSTAVTQAFISRGSGNPRLQLDSRLRAILQKPQMTAFVNHHNVGINHLQALAAGDGCLYTQKTCSEFHDLLCSLLRSYSYALSSLMMKSHGMLAVAEFKEMVDAVATPLAFLVYVAHSSMIETHLATIRTLLCLPTPMAHPGTRSSGARHVDPSYEGHEDLLALLDGQGTLSIVKLSHRWLCLQVLHLAAADILLGTMATPYKPISITFVASSNFDQHQSNATESWQDTIRGLQMSGYHREFDVDKAIAILQARMHHSQCLLTESGLLPQGQCMCMFSGKIHASAMLAAHMATEDAQVWTKLSRQRIIGTSEAACSACAKLLNLMNEHGPTYIQLTMNGSPAAMHVCRMPLSLPAQAIEKITFAFRERLRRLLTLLLSADRGKSLVSQKNNACQPPLAADRLAREGTPDSSGLGTSRAGA